MFIVLGVLVLAWLILRGEQFTDAFHFNATALLVLTLFFGLFGFTGNAFEIGLKSGAIAGFFGWFLPTAIFDWRETNAKHAVSGEGAA